MTDTPVVHHRLFAYGELTERGHQARLLGRAPDVRPAVLRDWRRAYLPGFPYPVALPTPGGVLRGVLLEGLDAWDMGVLDAWETTAQGLYRRGLVTVETAPGVEVTAAAYLSSPQAVRAWLTGEPTTRVEPVSAAATSPR